MKNYPINNEKTTQVNESVALYATRNFDDSGIFRMMEVVKQGITFKSFEGITKKFPFTMQHWADFLHISGKTLSRYQKENKIFEAPQSERILQIELLYARGTEVFGSKDYFISWLQTENIVLGKKKPQDLLDSSFGISLLMDELTRIEHGVLA